MQSAFDSVSAHLHGTHPAPSDDDVIELTLRAIHAGIDYDGEDDFEIRLSPYVELLLLGPAAPLKDRQETRDRRHETMKHLPLLLLVALVSCLVSFF